MCALLISVITLSGAANRSFHTTLEQWNPIGITQAPSGSSITNRLTAGSAILPTVATAAPSGVLRGVSTNVITFTTAKADGEKISLYMEYSGAAPTLSGATGTPESGKKITYKLTSQTVTITGDVTELYCNQEQLTTLDVSKNTALTKLYCTGNQLRALDVSKNTALTKLCCDNNQLTALDLSKNTALTGLICFHNQLTTLDVSKSTALTALYCDNNQLVTLDVSKNTALTGLYCSDNQLTALYVSRNTALTDLWCSNNQLTTLDVSQNTALEKLYCNGNQLTTLDVSKNTALTTLDCSLNQLTALDVSKNTALTALYCSLNQLTTLDVSKNTELETLNCSNNYSNNQLKALSQNTALTGLDCSLNQLTALDVSQNTALTDLDCSGNQIKGEEMTRLVNSLPDRTGMDDGVFTVVQEPRPEGNRCLKTHVAIAKGKNWNTYKYKSDTYDYVLYEGEEPIPYAVTLTKEGEGTLTATGAADLNAVPEGTELTIEATPAAGYELTALTANGTDILATKKFVVTAATEVKAIFTKKTAADVVESSSVRLYPNPASTYVNVRAAKADALVRLYDANGTLRYEARTDADGTLQIDLSAYAEGTYLLRVGNDAQRLLIQR